MVEEADAYTATPCCQFTIEREDIWQGALDIYFFNQEFDPSALKLEGPEQSQTRTSEFRPRQIQTGPRHRETP